MNKIEFYIRRTYAFLARKHIIREPKWNGCTACAEAIYDKEKKMYWCCSENTRMILENNELKTIL